MHFNNQCFDQILCLAIVAYFIVCFFILLIMYNRKGHRRKNMREDTRNIGLSEQDIEKYCRPGMENY
jgi:uncharacterized membrane protein